MELKLEVSDGVEPEKMGHIAPGVMMTPSVGEDFWYFRVRLNEAGQAILGFPKFSTIGVGFAQEEDWNTNLPYTTDAEKIWSHIEHNKADPAISDEDCLAAIRLIQSAAHRYKGTEPAVTT